MIRRILLAFSFAGTLAAQTFIASGAGAKHSKTHLAFAGGPPPNPSLQRTTPW